MSDDDQRSTSYCLESLNLLCEFSRMGAQNFLRCRRIKNAPQYNPYLLVLVMLWSHDLVMSWPFPTHWIWMLYNHIFNQYCIGTTFDLPDNIKQWPILCLLRMCTTDAGKTIRIFQVLSCNKVSMDSFTKQTYTRNSTWILVFDLKMALILASKRLSAIQFRKTMIRQLKMIE